MTSTAYPMPGFGAPAYEPKPSAAFALSIVGGALILLGGVSELLVGFSLGSLFPADPWFFLLGFVGIGLGAVVITFGSLLYLRPAHHVVFGVIVIVASLLSIAAYWGFVVGLVLGLVGGILAITWVPMRPFGWGYSSYPPPTAPPVWTRACLKCGALQTREAHFCSQCGGPLPTV